MASVGRVAWKTLYLLQKRVWRVWGGWSNGSLQSTKAFASIKNNLSCQRTRNARGSWERVRGAPAPSTRPSSQQHTDSMSWTPCWRHLRDEDGRHACYSSTCVRRERCGADQDGVMSSRGHAPVQQWPVFHIPAVTIKITSTSLTCDTSESDNTYF